MIRKIKAFVICVIASTINLAAQNITGQVFDEANTSLAYANIILQSTESTYIDGTVTDTTGRFVLAAHPDAERVQISFIGYRTEYRTLENLDQIKLFPDTEVLGNAMVKAVLPKTEIKGDALSTNIENTVLAQSGSANDVLAKLPGVTVKEDTYEVFGKGTPLIYINGRQVRDNSELEQLNSNEIMYFQM